MDGKELAEALVVWLWGDEDEVEERLGRVMEEVTVEVKALPLERIGESASGRVGEIASSLRSSQ